MANEKRLIDANALLEKVVFRLPIDNQNAEVIAGCVDITRRLIENSPTVDAVEVVRCKDCRHCSRDENIIGAYGYCYHFGCYAHEPMVEANDFCSYGERKDNK